MSEAIRLLVAGGGTGGHIFPLLAVARALEKIAPGSEIRFVGTSRGIESRLVPEAGYQLHTLSIGGLKVKSLVRRATTLLQLPWAVVVSAFLIGRFAPHVILGGGGYASGPVGLAARFLRIPLALLEINSLPGFTNRKLARSAEIAFITFPRSSDYLRCRTIVTGNPVRPEVRIGSPRPHGGAMRILIFGGSQGAAGLNSLVIDSLPHLIARGLELDITHQTGKLDFERVSQAYATSGIAAKIEIFIDDMPLAYRLADLVICRAGAGTVAELIAARRPSVLVPLPTAADNHQEHNARAIVEAGGGIILRQDETDGSILAERIADWYHRREELVRMGEALGKLDHPDAAERIAEELVVLARRER